MGDVGSWKIKYFRCLQGVPPSPLFSMSLLFSSEYRMYSDVFLFAGICGIALVAFLLAKSIWRKTEHWRKDVKTAKNQVERWEAIGKVSDINIYPIKSCHGVHVEEADCGIVGLTQGPYRDRSFMIVNENNNFLNARMNPSMVLIQPTIGNGTVKLTAPDTDPIEFSIPSPEKKPVIVKVFGDEVPAIDCGDEVAAWLSHYMFQEEYGARMVYYPQDYTSRKIETHDIFPWMKETDGALFHNLTPFMVMSEESLADLNSRLAKEDRVSMFNFRPVITISGCLHPYEEDSIIFMKIGEDACTFRQMKLCQRCTQVTVNPETGIKSPNMEPLRTLRKYRLPRDEAVRKVVGDSPFMGVNYALEKPGHIRIGDVVYAGRFKPKFRR